MATPETGAPLLDDRTAADILAHAQSLAKNVYLKNLWQGHDDPDDPAFQLLTLFGRLMEILLERLNRVPDKNFLAFLDMLGVEPSPGHPASAPLTFVVAAKAESGGFIPAGTQVATTQTDTANAEIFETRAGFFATPAKLIAAVDLEPGADRFAVVPLPPSPPKPLDLAADPTIVLGGAAASGGPLPHTLYLGDATLFGKQEAHDVTVEFTVVAGDASLLSASNLRWQRHDAAKKIWQDVAATYDTTTPGIIKVKLPAFAGNGKTTIAGREDFWVACHFDGSFPPGVTVPSLSAVRGGLAAGGGVVKVQVERALYNTTPLDVSKPFAPFGERPRYGDAFYLLSNTAFAPEVQEIAVDADLKVRSLTQLEGVFATIVAATTITTTVAWQYWTTDGAWKTFREATYTLTVTNGAPPTFNPAIPVNGPTVLDDGVFFSVESRRHTHFTFTRPGDMAAVTVAGQAGLWIRALIKSDDPYGRDGFVAGANPLKVVQPTWIAPVLESIALTPTYKAQLPYDVRLVSENNLRRVAHNASAPLGAPFRPFIAPAAQAVDDLVAAFSGGSGLYLGFDRPFGEVYVSLFFQLADNFPTVEKPAETGKPNLAWEYLAASGWRPLDVADETGQLTRSGTVSFAGPQDAAARRLFDALDGGPGRTLYWLRARLADGYYQYPPQLRGIYPNTVMADNRRSHRGALVLGSGSGEKAQSLRLPRAPVLGGSLWVREPEAPGSAELAELERQCGEDRDGGAPVSAATELAAGTEREVWVRWRRVANFLASGPRDRHYTLNPLDGEIRLGDGTRGLLPPVAKDNLSFRDYQTGGGELANRVAGPLAIKELKSSLPYVDKVFNVEPATAGSDPWGVAEILQFGPQLLKNKGRAVSAEDFEWMVLQRFSQVARAKCLATRAPDPSGLKFKPGAVTMIVVPKSGEPRPRPPTALLEAIREYLVDKMLGTVTTEVYVLGPGFTEVAVKARVKARDLRERSELERRALQALETFFHPLHGGEDGRGWAFGRDVQIGEIHAVLQRVPGLDYVESVAFLAAPGAASITVDENHLVVGGTHDLETF